VTSIGNTAFSGCTGLTSFEIPNSVTSIGYDVFYGCTGLTSIEIPNSVTRIGNGAFYGCTGLTSIEIPNSVTSIGQEAFYGCTGLTSIEIPNSVTSIGDYAFDGCTGLTSITVPRSVTSIGYGAFNGCTGLKAVHISDLAAWCGKDFGGNYANPLCYAKNLYLNGELVTELVIPDGVKEIKNYTFSGCGGLTSIIIPNSVTSIGNGAFWHCTGLTSIEIPNSVTSIGEYAFSGCSGLTSITIPNSVTSIGNGAFYNCYGLTSIEIPNSVTSIGNYAFYGCTGLTSITIPDSVTSIGDYAFDGCTGLTSITVPRSVTSIGYGAFKNCSGLTSVVIGNSVESIKNYAFEGCKGLKSITSFIPADNLFVPGYNSFYNVNKTSCTLYVPYGAKETYAATSRWNEFVNIVEMAPESQLGDINKDNEVNVGDFAALANIIFNSESIDDTIKSVSDINADGEVNVGDFAALVNLIFNSGSQASLQRAATRAAADETTFYIEPFSIAAGETKVIPVLMENPDDTFSQLQFDITLPEGLEIPEYFDEEQFAVVKDIKRGSRTKSVYNIQTQPVGEALRVLCTTQNAYAFFTGVSGDVLLITVKAADNIAIGDVDIKITNTVLSRQDGTTYKPADCTATVTVTDGSTTGIDDVKGENGEMKTIYDLQGRKVDTLNRGLYIIDGKKVMIK
ncbi:MAG: leucine-rich repeat protein, partial [Bacteroidaceae bacterium]|nr:leucine-rich repeat protein [Bacteroidaceae bacterium]